MNLSRAQSIDDLRKLAKRRLPKILFELIESGVEDETSLQRNRDAFGQYTFLPRYLGDISRRDQGVELFGRRYAHPFGIGPTGFGGLMRRGGDVFLAEAATAAGIPIVLSGASIASVERVSKVAPGNLWTHIYPARDTSITYRILDRYVAAGVDVLVITVDNPIFPKRDRDNRNGFVLPLKMPPAILLEALTHPAWLFEYVTGGGMPMLESWREYAPPRSSAEEVATFFRSHSPSTQTWASVAEMRRHWPGKIVMKGIQHPDDAVRAVEAGMDGIIVSNHGGKSFDPLPSPLTTLPDICRAVGDRVPVMFDSGIRRGWEMLVALALGACFTFVARATLYGVAAGGRAGADKAIGILVNEIDISLAMIGAPSVAALDSSYLLEGKAAP
jgi:L-lactate dehydrogenase (cytochrome)/(S)-mandelate dehydrogenase